MPILDSCTRFGTARVDTLLRRALSLRRRANLIHDLRRLDDRGLRGLIFARRLWANRVIRKAGFPRRSREAKLLLDLLVRASKRNPKDLPKSEQVLFAALRMFHSQAAIARMAETLQVSRVHAESTLARLPNAAIAIAAEKRMEQFVDVANRIHFP
jgi:hypothetical protein